MSNCRPCDQLHRSLGCRTSVRVLFGIYFTRDPEIILLLWCCYPPAFGIDNLHFQCSSNLASVDCSVGRSTLYRGYRSTPALLLSSPNCLQYSCSSAASSSTFNKRYALSFVQEMICLERITWFRVFPSIGAVFSHVWIWRHIRYSSAEVELNSS
jgi:hypothetical protein